jgi:hypothetical protein
VLLGVRALATEVGNPDSRDVIEDGFGRSCAESDIDQHAGRARSSAESPRFVDELSNTLITRPRQAKALCVAADAPAGFGDRVSPLVVADNCFEELLADPRRQIRHAASFAGPGSRECAGSVPSNTVLLG